MQALSEQLFAMLNEMGARFPENDPLYSAEKEELYLPYSLPVKKLHFYILTFIFEIRDLWPESAIETGVVQNKFVINLAFWLEKIIYKNCKRIKVEISRSAPHFTVNGNPAPGLSA